MTIKNSPEERLLITLIEKMPAEASEKIAWTEQIQANGMSEELAAQIHEKLTAHVENNPHVAGRARLMLDFSRLVNRWRMASQRKNFKR